MIINEHVSFSSLTTFKVGSTARFVVDVSSRSDVRDSFQFARDHNLQACILGGGSNTLGSDTPLNRVVIRSVDYAYDVKEHPEFIAVHVGAGMEWDSFVRLATENGWRGIENLSSIPGTVGGAIAQNIGAYGAVLSDVLEEVDVYDVSEDVFRTFTKDQCSLGYRSSVFKKNQGRYFIVAATFTFEKNKDLTLSYADLEQYFKDKTPTVGTVRSAVQSIRAKKFPPLAVFGTAGSFFLNPVTTFNDAERIQAKYPKMPLFVLPEGGVKIPIAWILDHVLHAQDMRVGGAFVWPKQTLVIATDSNATARDVAELSEKISSRVFSEVKIKIFPEVMML